MYRIAIGLIIAFILDCSPMYAQLNEYCVVSVLKRTVQMNADGTWVDPNIPANFGPVRARATCDQNCVMTFGRSDFFTIPASGATKVRPIILGNATPIPSSVTVTAPITSLAQMAQTTRSQSGLSMNGTTQDVTAASAGTTYNVSNAKVAEVRAGGLVTAVGSGTAIVQALNRGAQGIIKLLAKSTIR